MRLDCARACDVLVLGSGIAGVTAAMEAAAAGRSVLLACKGRLFSGSSFYPGTWGLGLIGPTDKNDERDLADTIEMVGCGMADPAMVRAFAAGIHPAIEQVRAMGVKLRRADNGGQKEYIPCFDHKHRDWNGIEFDSAREIFSRRLEELGVTVLPGCEALELIRAGGRVCGAVVAQGGSLCYFGCKALVLATGGYGGLFKYHLCTADVEGVGQSLALDAGCRLVNMEFMQMMPGYVSPAYQTIFNEKTFRFTRLRRMDSRPLLDGGADKLLAQRSTHGPFTSRLSSKAVDLALFQAFLEDERGVEVTYTEEMRSDPPEFVKTYFDWLCEARGLTMDDPIHIGIFAHAANGGIKIDPNASTGVPGLFAAGEITGGMHGADRIGGLSTANGLVFGGKAGRSAAEACNGTPEAPGECEFQTIAADNAPEALSALRETMFRNAMVIRSERGLSAALSTVEGLRADLSLHSSGDIHAITQTRRLISRLRTAEAVLRAALLRRESRGAHYRADHPEPDPDQAKPIFISQDSGAIRARFAKEDARCP